ncbi:mechanosensitive ion channel domain-containing protein [uncultured Fretibacterium sp.]|uniref:mechanosensitive ion channel family protein n=1 Tax=uncultured Fretibacterium sp. TaxID=1678694 RepID=UPI00260F674B|nr:mechanosensitive ion channel domain-containing protein [uncultured Fretibacterium sp.]
MNLFSRDGGRRSRLMAGGMLTLVLCLALSSPVLSATDTGGDAAEGSGDTVAILQQRVSEDIAGSRDAVEAELKDFPLGSADVALRMKQLVKLTASASEDAVQWGYTDAERERYAHLLSDLNLAYAAYNTNLKTLSSRQDSMAVAVTASKDAELSASASSDINAYDALNQAIHKSRQELDLMVFNLRSVLNKLSIGLSDVSRFREEAESTLQDGTTLSNISALEIERVRLNLASSWLQAREAKQRCDEIIRSIRQDRKRLQGVRAALTFPEEALNRNVGALQTRIDDLKKQMTAVRGSFDDASSSLSQARAAVDADSADAGALTPANTRFMARLANLNYWEYYTTLIQDEIGFLTDAQNIWRARYRLFNEKATGEDIWRYRNDAQVRISELQTHLESIQTLQSDFYQRISTTRNMAGEATGKTRQNLNQMLQSQQDTIANVLNRYAYLLPYQIMLERTLYEEASARIDTLRLAEKVGDFGRKTFLSFWNTELWKGEGYSVTISKLLTALMVFISSFFLSAWGSRWIQRRMIRRFSASITAANATQRIVFYVLWFSFVLIALQIVNIPLTAFAFLGGALVLAIGFGAQTLFNNLISGFIIMFSRPFKIADIIEVDGTSGTVEEIGSRSTRIKTWENIDVIMPNRYLLENRVTNWTGSDTKKRDTLKVGVSYDSDSRHVEELLLKVLKDHSKILKDPAPFVLFQGFGDSSLDFMLYFWVDLSTTSSIKVASDMRHHILSLFRQEGVDIPYPQMDVRFPAAPERGGAVPKPPKPKAEGNASAS